MATTGPILTLAEVRAADARAASHLGLSTSLLMENAGRGLAIVTHGEKRRYDMDGVLVVASRGHNGGDGLVAARHLHRMGISVRVLLACPIAAVPADSDPGRNLHSVLALGIPVAEVLDTEALDAASRTLGPRTLIVDAVLGTGLRGPVRGHLEAVLEWMGASGRPVVAADLPSGLDADSGEEHGPVPRCVATATFLAMKRGLTVGSGPGKAGRISVCDIGVPVDALRPGPSRMPPGPS